MRYASIRDLDISNGEGVGVALFVQGCPFHCHNCFNPETWDLNGGKEWTEDVENQFMKLVQKPHIKRISILGGEPLLRQNRHKIFLLCQCIKETYPHKKIWLYSGYTYEQIIGSREMSKVLYYTDVLVDGPYIEEQRDITLPFRGSANQRLIDVPETLKQNKIVTLQID